MKTLHTAYRVTDLAASLGFYSALGYREVGRVGMGDGASLTMLTRPPFIFILFHFLSDSITRSTFLSTADPLGLLADDGEDPGVAWRRGDRGKHLVQGFGHDRGRRPLPDTQLTPSSTRFAEVTFRMSACPPTCWLRCVSARIGRPVRSVSSRAMVDSTSYSGARLMAGVPDRCRTEKFLVCASALPTAMLNVVRPTDW